MLKPLLRQTSPALLVTALGLSLALVFGVVGSPATASPADDEGADGKKSTTDDAGGDEVDALIQAARDAYAAGDAQGAVAKLQEAIGRIQREHEKGLVAFCPDAPEGWDAKEPKSQSGSHGSGEAHFQWTAVERRYQKQDAKGSWIDITITNSPQIVAGPRAMLKMFENEAYLKMMTANDPNKTYAKLDRAGWAGWTITDTKRDSAELFAIGDVILVQIKARGAGSKDAVTALADSVRWAELKELDTK